MFNINLNFYSIHWNKDEFTRTNNISIFLFYHVIDCMEIYNFKQRFYLFNYNILYIFIYNI